MPYDDDRTWSDTYVPTIRQILGPHLVDVTPERIDWAGADFMILTGHDMKVAARVRRPEILQKYPDVAGQFTVRSRRSSGAKTELQKIIEGFADWMFYGHARDNQSLVITPWYLIDLDAFRAHMIRSKWSLTPASVNGTTEQIRYGEKKNVDGKTRFAWFEVDSFPSDPRLLIASSREPLIT